jgi:peptide/nickel transport system ATP-binding protein
MRAVALRNVFCVHRTSEGDAAALQGTTLTVARGEIVCVLGPSGAGKSTLLQVIAGLQTPSAGEVSVLGEEVGRAPSRVRARLRQACIGFLSQNSGAVLSPDLSIGDSVMMPLALRGVGRGKREARRDGLLEAVGLADAAAARPGRLSGGERQRAALCVALAHRPQLLLADEPTGELDEDSADEIRRLIVGLVRSEGTTAVLVSHDPSMGEIADRTIRMRDGRLVEEGSALVVGSGGWIRLPPELLADAGIGDRVRIQPAAGGLLVTGANGRVPDAPVAASAPNGPTSHGPDAPSPTPGVVEAHALTKRYGSRTVLDGLSWTFATGALTVVTGRSGTGKTTLLSLLCGLVVPDDGELIIDGTAVGGDNPEQRAARRRARIGYLPQDPAPVGFLSAVENVVLALRVRGWSAADAGERATEVLARLGLGERLRQRVSRLSAGEAQRVALARALATARGLVIVDEPTSRLDERAATDVATWLAAHAAAEGQTIICATHDERVIAHADAVLALSRARPPRPASPVPRETPR